MEDLSEEQEIKDDKYKYDVNTVFKEFTHNLPKKNRYKSTKIYQKAAELVDSLNELYIINDNKKLMARIFILLTESLK
jgi:ribosomal protein S20